MVDVDFSSTSSRDELKALEAHKRQFLVDQEVS
jgi:hypothetical protein